MRKQKKRQLRQRKLEWDVESRWDDLPTGKQKQVERLLSQLLVAIAKDERKESENE